MPRYATQLLRREEIARDTMAFHFAKPAGLDFKAGQNVDWFLHNPPYTDAEGNKRTFSLTSTPLETELSIATRMRNTAFKHSLKEIPLGTELELDGPYGSLSLHNDSTKRAVLLAGGIGITPFYSIAKTAAVNKLPHTIYLFYSNRTPADAAFMTELLVLEKQNQNFKLILTFTDTAHESITVSHETGYITAEMLKKYIGDTHNAIFYIAGPPAMVTAMKQTLHDSGVDDDYIKNEDFTGY